MDSLTDYDIWIFGSREPDRYSIAASVVILYYDYLLTINSEYNLFWLDSRLSWISFFYFLNRYTALIAQVPVIVEFFWDLSPQWQISLFRGLPAYPNGKLRICDLPLTKEQGKRIYSYAPILEANSLCTPSALAWSQAIAFDCIIFALTLYKRLQIGRTVENSLFSLMLRDGTMYFGFLGLAYVFELLNFLVWGDIVQMASLTNAIASTLISRLMLNIRDPKNSGLQHSTIDPTSSIAFNYPEALSSAESYD
ncbi:hypothetical protein QCA50_013473 [Cerrena zonata]|uniref:DUF6533 domain-containing protein n=1 Tax=Cerrena zonata TaxID=2478898 RepID=A0AAW0G3K3_9APHY